MSARLLAVRPLLAAVLAAHASAQSVEPAFVELDLDPGESETVTFEVCIPGQGKAQRADIYFLSDVTASTQPTIDEVIQNANLILQTLFNDDQVDVQIGVGQYRDFPSQVAAFQHLQDITDEPAAVVAALSSWQAMGGGDPPEAQLYALHRIAIEEDPIGWRESTKRIIVWFGDQPGHEPICQAMSGDPHGAITRDTVIEDLLANGLGGTVVIAIDTMNLDGGGTAGNYILICGPEPFPPGQVTEITTATGGVFTQIGDPSQVTEAILDAIQEIFDEVTVQLSPAPELAPFVTAIEPPFLKKVEVPVGFGNEVCVTFDVTFEGGPCQENTPVFGGLLELDVDDKPFGGAFVRIAQPGCVESVCMLNLGLAPTAVPIGGPDADPNDVLLTAPVVAWPVLVGDVPTLPIPDDAALTGFHVYLQVTMSNPFDFPDDPIQVSQGLDVEIGVGATDYGAASGMDLWLASPPTLGGVLQPAFTIDGLAP